MMVETKDWLAMTSVERANNDDILCGKKRKFHSRARRTQLVGL